MNWLAWIVAIVAFFAIKTGIDVIAHSVGFVTYVDFGETVTVTRCSGRYAYDEDIDGASTTFGITTMLIAGMLACRIGSAISSGRIDGGLSAKAKIDFKAWLAGFVFVALLGALLCTYFGDSRSDLVPMLHPVLDLGALGLAFYVCKTWRDLMIYRLDKCAADAPKVPQDGL